MGRDGPAGPFGVKGTAGLLFTSRFIFLQCLYFLYYRTTRSLWWWWLSRRLVAERKKTIGSCYVHYFHFLEPGRNGYPGPKGPRGDVGVNGPNVNDEKIIFLIFLVFFFYRLSVADELDHLQDHKAIPYVSRKSYLYLNLSMILLVGSNRSSWTERFSWNTWFSW